MKLAGAPRARVRHLARFVGPNGQVSPWCAKKPRAIDLRKATWTNRPEAATCKRCLDAKASNASAVPSDGDLRSKVSKARAAGKLGAK